MSKKNKTLTAVRVTPLEYDAVMKISQSRDISISEVVRLAVLNYCEPKYDVPDEATFLELSQVAQKLALDDLREVLEYAKYRLEKSSKMVNSF